MPPLEVLLVEDDDADALLLQETLRGSRTRPKIERVRNLTAAVDRLEAGPDPDVVLLDLGLPESEGLPTLKSLLATEPAVPVVVLTGVDDDATAHAAVERGAQDYLVKGTVTSDVMARTLEHAVERHRLQAALKERVKELRGLYGISRATADATAPKQMVCRTVAEQLVEAMQWPRLCGADVVIDDERCGAGAEGAPDDGSVLTAGIEVRGVARGHIRVGYAEEDRPFILPEEQQLVDGAARAVAEWLERRDTREQLVRDEERLRLMVAQLPGMVWTTDRQFRITSYAGAKLVEIGIHDDRFVGASVMDVLETAPAAQTMEMFEAALAGRSGTFERQWRGRWWRNHIGPKLDDRGAIAGVVCLTLDVTDEKQQESELETTRRRLQGLFANALDAMMLVDDDGRFVDSNPAASELTCYSREQLTRLHPWDLVTDTRDRADRTETRALWDRLLADRSLTGELTLRRSTGESIAIDFRAVADVVPGVHLITARDVTARKQAEAALEASESRFRTMAEAAQDAIYRLRLEPHLAFEYLNPAAEEISGFPPQAFYDNPYLYLERVHPDDAPKLDPAQLVPNESRTMVVRFRRADGEWVVLEDRRSLIVEDGRAVGAQGIIRDITAREQTERALREALRVERDAVDRLRAVDDVKSSFLTAVSHELRTPLTSVLGYAKMLVARGDRFSDDQIVHFHGRISENAERLEILIRDLLDVARIGRGRIALDRRPTDLAALAARVAEALDLGDRTLELPEEVVLATVDAEKVERIVHSLLSNAGRHTPPGTRIWLDCRKDGDRTVIEVADDGPGVPPDAQEKVFEPFWQGPDMRDAASPGTGIGLSLVRQFAALHGGRAWVEPRPGGGARFLVELPGPERPVPGGAAAPEEDERAAVLERTVAETIERLRTVNTPGEALGVIIRFVEETGGRVVTTDEDPDVVEFELAPVEGDAIRIAAPEGSDAREFLETHLPLLVAQAERAVTQRGGAPEPDPVTGVVDPAALRELLDPLRLGDTVIVVTLPATARPAPEGDRRDLEKLLATARRALRRSDLAVPTGAREVTLILRQTAVDDATEVLHRLELVWTSGRRGADLATGVALVGDKSGPEAHEAARRLAAGTTGGPKAN